MRFEKDVFISYAHIDNKPLSADQQGWISRFHETLETVLNQRKRRKEQVKVWRDERKLLGNHDFSAEIIAQFSQTALLYQFCRHNI